MVACVGATTMTAFTRAIGTMRTALPPPWPRSASCSADAKSFGSPLVTGSSA